MADDRHLTAFMRRVRAGGDIFELLAEASVPDVKVYAPNGARGGVGVLRDYGRVLRTAFPDLSFAVEHASIAGDRLVVQCEFTGTHTGPLLDVVAPTGRRVSSPGCVITRLDEAGRIVEIWGYLNMAAPLFAPPPGGDLGPTPNSDA